MLKKEIKIANSTYVFDGETLNLFLKNKENYDYSKETNKTEQNKLFNKNKHLHILHKLVFNVSNMCNLNCKYCYASGGNYDRENAKMSIETVDRIIADVAKNYDKIGTVYFFGGEPLLNFDIIRYAVKKLEKIYSNQKIDFRTVTNGVFLSTKKGKFFYEHNFRVYVSLDGPKQFQDFLRGENTYNIITENLKKNKELYPKLNIQLLCTYTKVHQDQISFEDLTNYFEKLGYPYIINGVDTSDKNLKLIEKQSTIEREKEYIDNSINRIITNGNNLGTSYYLTSIIDALLFNYKQKYFCKELANNYSNVYDFNGEKYSCIRLLGKYKINADEIKKANEKSFDLCKKCWCKNFCNICVAEVLLNVDDYPCSNEKSCKNQELYEYALRKVLELYHNNIKDFQALINNYYMRFTK